VPAEVTVQRVPTNIAIIGGRTYAGGPADYAVVHAPRPVQAGSALSIGPDYTPPDDVPLKPSVEEAPVGRQVMAGGSSR
jgi:hypothetical protein